jgi:hypothetical protein
MPRGAPSLARSAGMARCRIVDHRSGEKQRLAGYEREPVLSPVPPSRAQHRYSDLQFWYHGKCESR